MTKRPAFQWYPGDWQRDTALRACSLEARGLWIEMLNLMHDGIPYGHLTAGGVPIVPLTLAGMVGVKPAKKVTALLADLEAHGVFSRTEAGVIYSRRMIKDERIRTVRAEAGRLGGNPDLVKQQDNQNGEQKRTPAVLQLRSSSASAPPEGRRSALDTGEASLIVGRIRSELVETATAPGHGISRFVRRERVEALGTDVLRAFDGAGGADRVLNATGADFGYMLRDFAQALKAARSA